MERGQYSITVVIDSQLKTRRCLIFHVTILWIGGLKYHRLRIRYTMGRGTIYYGRRVNIPSQNRNIRQEVLYFMGRESKYHVSRVRNIGGS